MTRLLKKGRELDLCEAKAYALEATVMPKRTATHRSRLERTAA